MFSGAGCMLCDRVAAAVLCVSAILSNPADELSCCSEGNSATRGEVSTSVGSAGTFRLVKDSPRLLGLVRCCGGEY